MSILNNYKKKLPFLKMNNSEYYDFVLSKDQVSYGNGNNGMVFSFDYSCDSDDNGTLKSKEGVYWKDYVNDGVIVKDIGFTGVDNGLITFNRDTITKKDFAKILTNTEYEISPDDKSIVFKQVKGNIGLYSYDVDQNCEENALSLKGGFYQGFSKMCGYDYSVFPRDINCGWTIEMEIKPKDYEINNDSLNKTHFDTDGFIFYVGTRAENKYVQFYDNDLSKYEDRIIPEWLKLAMECDTPNYFVEDENWDGNITIEENKCCNKPQKISNSSMKLSAYDYMFIMYHNNKFYGNEICDCIVKKEEEEVPCECEQNICDNGMFTIDEDYYVHDEKIDVNNLITSDGNELSGKIKNKVITDNKYLIFDRTKSGYTVKTWNDDDLMEIEYEKRELTENPYLVYNRTKTGITVHSSCKNKDNVNFYTSKQEYKISSDITENAFGIRIREDGSIGYRYIVSNCESDEKFKVEEEYGFSGAIKKDEWNFITIKLISAACPQNNGAQMKVLIYVNGKLKFVSKFLPMLKLRALTEEYSKQRGVPFNISIGGGTMGLAESILYDFDKPFTKILPIEKYFAGSFIGDIRKVNLYVDSLDFAQITTNYKNYKINRLNE